MPKMTVRDIDVAHRQVFLRVDFNVPIDAAGKITEDVRIREALPTIRYLIEHKAKVVIGTHLGRPKGVDEKLRMGVVGQRLSQILGQPVTVTRDCIGPEVEKAVSAMNDGEVLLLENLRFYAQEEKNDDAFAKALSRLADLYVNDAFGTMHRAHASIVAITRYLPSTVGLLAQKEIEIMGKLLTSPAHPFATIIGGAKISDKVAMLENIMGKIDYLLIGGGLAATFLKAASREVGKSLIEDDMLSTAARLMDNAKKRKIELLLPEDAVVADEIKASARTSIVTVDKILPDVRIVDIGPKTAIRFAQTLSKCNTVFWNGPMGIFEIPEFAGGTKIIGQKLASLKATTVTGGGSTAEAVIKLGLADKFSFVSTGGGAALEFLSGLTLPGVAAIPDKK
ncbi:MAG: phosphoglycerate kinase [Chloroflexi bacterium]|nr:phosphoglycerate kinase [Chloroflexota bacterium]